MSNELHEEIDCLWDIRDNVREAFQLLTKCRKAHALHSLMYRQELELLKRTHEAAQELLSSLDAKCDV